MGPDSEAITSPACKTDDPWHTNGATQALRGSQCPLSADSDVNAGGVQHMTLVGQGAKQRMNRRDAPITVSVSHAYTALPF